jgi:chromosome segregation protein
MRVTRLEIFGFKSFVDRFVLNFDKNVIGIVGPNGCGKSNIVDSLRWVLGESQARQLRGNVFDDLIFNGSESRRPLGMAEVSITVRPDEGWFTSPEQLLRDNAIREKDIVEELNEAIDKETAEGEGKILTASSEAAVSEIAQALVAEEENPLSSLLEIPGIFESSEIQLTRRLYRSGESEYFINRVPCRLRDMVELYRLIGLGARGLSIVQQGQIGDIVSKKPIERRELLEEAAGIAGFRSRVEAAERKLKKSIDNLARLGDVIVEVDKQVKSLRRQASKAKNRAELKEQLQESELKVFKTRSAHILLTNETSQQRHGELVAKHTEAESVLNVARANQEQAHAQLESFDVELSDFRQKREVVGREINRRHKEEEGLRIELVKLQSKLNASDDSFLKLNASRDQYLQQIAQVEESIAAHEVKAVDAREKLAELEKALSDLQQNTAAQDQSEGVASVALAELQQIEGKLENLDTVSKGVSELERQLAQKRSGLNGTREHITNKRLSLASVDAEIASINKQLIALSEHVTAETGAGEQEVSEVLLAAITVPTELQSAVSAVLGEKGSFVVSQDAADLLKRFESNTQRSKSNKKIGVIDAKAFAKQVSSSDLSKHLGQDHALLLERIKVRPEYQNLLSSLLANVVVVETLEQANSLRQTLLQDALTSFTIVTRAGEVVTEWGWYTTLGQGASFSFTRRIEEAKQQAERLQNELQAFNDALQGEEQALNALQEQHRALKAERESLLSLQNRAANLRKDVAREERQQRERALEKERQAQAVVKEAQRAVSAIEHEATKLKSKIEHFQNELQRLTAEEARLHTQKQEAAQAIADLETRRQADSTAQYLEESQRLSAEYDALGEQIEALETQRRQVRMSLSDASTEVDKLRKQLDGWSSEIHQIEVALERGTIEREMILEEIRRKYDEALAPVSLEQAREVREQLPNLQAAIREFEDDADRLRKRIEREGEVDPESIELYEIEQTRLDTLIHQRDDLDKAIKTLERTIRQLKQISRVRFLNTFNFVSKKFAELIPRLYGGGAGSMELVNPEDPLTSGIELSVRPPGKKLRSMELMSGGEKALAATAVLVAMFLYRPSPICVLDEVDAPLDDVNLDRFLAIIKEIAQSTQFLIITHNKQTMGAVDRLIGITMEEAGVSTALTVTLDEAEAELTRWAANG